MKILGVLLLLVQDPLPGEQLIERLKDPSTRSAAYYELVRRGTKEELTEAGFRAGHRNSELVVCPQGEGKPPIYLLLSDFLSRDQGPGTFEAGDDKLFPPKPGGARKKKKLIEVFTSDGKLITPFGGANVLDNGLCADLNGDGLVEMADGGGYSLKNGKSASVFQVSVVREKAEPIFAVVYRFGAWDAWGYDSTDEDGDGRPEFRLGPRTVDGEIVPRATYKWDPATKSYSGPKGGPGDHFRVIDPKNLWKELRRLEEEKVVFDKEDEQPSLPKKAPAGKGEAERYTYASLKGRTDQELFDYMGRGPQAAPTGWRSEKATQEPPGLWTLDAREAALALVQANLPQKDKSLRVAIDDRGDPPGEIGTAQLTSLSSRCYWASDTFILLQCDPKSSFLAMAHTVEPGVVMRESSKKGQPEEVRFLPLDYAEARRVLQILGWLERVRSRSDPRNGVSIISSTGDGQGTLKVQFAGRPAIEAEGRLWPSSIPSRWGDQYEKETQLNFSAFFFHRLVDRKSESALEQEKACSRILELHLADPKMLPSAMTTAALAAAGNEGMVSLAPILEKLRDRALDGPRPGEALAKLAAVRDLPALEAMANENGKKSDWALAQIRRRFRDQVPRILEDRVRRASGQEAADLLAELAGVDPVRAKTFAGSLHAHDRGPLGRAAFLILRELPEMDREQDRVKAQLATALDENETSKARSGAIDALVPPNKPRRFPGKEIDEALEKILATTPVDQGFRYETSHAAEGLFLRRGAAAFDAVMSKVLAAKDSFLVTYFLRVAGAMIPQASAEQRGRYLEFLKGHLQATNFMMSELCLEIWAADLRELKGDLERIATSGPTAEESERADTAGGEVAPVTGKYHRARQVAQLWNEEDAPTRAKLLVALGLDVAYDVVGEQFSGKRLRFARSLGDAAKSLTADQRNDVVAFAAAFAAKSRASRTEELVAVIRDAMK